MWQPVISCACCGKTHARTPACHEPVSSLGHQDQSNRPQNRMDHTHPQENSEAVGKHPVVGQVCIASELRHQMVPAVDQIARQGYPPGEVPDQPKVQAL